MKKLSIAIFLICFVTTAKSQYNKEVIIETIIKTDTNSIGQQIRYPTFVDDEVTILKVTIPPGKSTGWHKHEIPVFAYVLKGELTVELENNQTLQFTENSSFAEVLNTFHNGVNNGICDVVLIAFYLGQKGKPLSLHKN